MKKTLLLLLVVVLCSSAIFSLSEDVSDRKKMPLLNVVMMASAGKDGSGDVVNAINDYLAEKLGVQITLTFISYGNYANQTNLMLAAGDSIDVFPNYLTPLTTMANNGLIKPLDELLEKFGTGIKDQIAPEFLQCGKVDGQLFGITTGRDLAAAYGFEMRKEICDKYNIDYANIKTLDQLYEALMIVHKNEPNLVCVVPSHGELIRNWGWDTLGDARIPLGVLMDYGRDSTVVNLFETEYYKSFITTMRKWYLDGLIMQDAIANTESVGVMMGAGTAFGGFMNLKPYFEVQETTNYGTPIVVSEIIPAFSATSNVNMATWCIAESTKYPEESMKLLNLMYSDPVLMNLMIYGIEGTHYVALGDATNGQKVIGFPEGIDSTNTTYRPSGGWLWCNQFIGHVWNGNPPDYWDVTREFNKNSIKSSAFGFVWDASEVKNEVTACTNVMNKYHKALMCGAIDPEENLPKFNEELKNAGIEAILKSKQTQLNEWLKNK